MSFKSQEDLQEFRNYVESKPCIDFYVEGTHWSSPHFMDTFRRHIFINSQNYENLQKQCFCKIQFNSKKDALVFKLSEASAV